MPYVKVTGYIEVPDEDYEPTGEMPVKPEAQVDVKWVRVGDLTDLAIQRDDREVAK